MDFIVFDTVSKHVKILVLYFSTNLFKIIIRIGLQLFIINGSTFFNHWNQKDWAIDN